MTTTRRILIGGGLAALGCGIGSAAAQVEEATPLVELQGISFILRRGTSDARFSPDGRRILTRDTILGYLFDAETGAELAELSHGGWGITGAEFSPDGTRIATASTGRSLLSTDHTARLWDASSGRQAGVLGAHETRVNGATFSPDSARLATWDDRNGYIWDVRRRRRLAVLRGHTAGVLSADFTPDSASVLTTSFDQTARLWHGASGEARAVVQLDNNRPAVRFSADGLHILTFGIDGATAQLWDARTGSAVANLHGHTGRIHNATFSPDSARIATASEDGTVRIWDLNGSAALMLGDRTSGGGCIAFSPDNQCIITGTDGAVRLWDLSSGRERALLERVDSRFIEAKYNDDGSRIVTFGDGDGARLWNGADGRPISVMKHEEVLRRQGGNIVASVDFSQDGTRIVTNSGSSVLIWSM